MNFKHNTLYKYKIKIRSFSNLNNIIQPQKPDLVLPTPKNPLVICVATRREIANIPRNQYVVKILRPLRSLYRGDKMEERLVVMIKHVELLKKEIESLRYDYRIRKRNGGGDGLPPSNLFYEPIDEGKMADCILKNVNKFFHDDETCTILDKEYNRMEFCVLVHIYFKYIGILKNKSRLSFSTYLQFWVFAGKSEFGERTYNTYANKDIFKNLEKELSNTKVSFRFHPEQPKVPDGKFLMRAFQEIGYAFHHSDYFDELRELNKTMQCFDIQ